MASPGANELNQAKITHFSTTHTTYGHGLFFYICLSKVLMEQISYVQYIPYNIWFCSALLCHGYGIRSLWIHMTSFTDILQGCFTGTAEAIQRSSQCQWRHDDVIKWKHFPRYWPFVRGIHRSMVNSLHKGQWRGALMFSLICAQINRWVNNCEAGDLRRYRAHYEVIVMNPEKYGWKPQVSNNKAQITWWRYQIETFSTLLAIYEETPLVSGGFPSQRPVMLNFHIFFDLSLNQRLRKQLRCRWFEMPSHSLWRHCNDALISSDVLYIFSH